MRSAKALVVVLLAACSGNNGSRFQAEVLSTPFPGVVLTAHASDVKCEPEGCTFDYRVRITNPTDGAADVLECMLEGPPLKIYVGAVAGLYIRAHETKTVTAHFILPLKRNAASELVGRRAGCVGLDWHGHPPI